MTVAVRLLGEFTIVIDGREVSSDGFTRRSAATLVQLLALQPGHRIHREQALDALWPDSSPDDAANALYKAAHFARRATGAPDCVVLQHEIVSLFPGQELLVDVEVFEASARAALAAQDEVTAADALKQWTGDVLPDEP